jgi:ATP-dependent DNA helicase Rep
MLDKDEQAADAVQLATLHAAKGLEFRHVFLVGVEEGILPHRESTGNGAIEEERRLMYVGITRAQQSLVVTWCERRKQGRDILEREPSRFIAEMGDDLRIAGKGRNEPATKETGQAKLAAFRNMLARK